MEYPDVLLLDEPFNALDDESYIEAKNVLLEMKNNFNTTIVIATHDKCSYDIFDYKLRIKDGKLQ